MPAVRRYPSPVGELVLVGGAAGLAAVLWPDEGRCVRIAGGIDARTLIDAVPGAVPVGDPVVGRLLDEAARQLDQYFAGRRFTFDLALDPFGTEFQLALWRSLAGIGYGETATYGDQAARIGRPTAVRAVGAAIGRNPLSIVLPCHRVVGSDGRLTGFAGGLEAKAFLLEHEARHRR